MKKKSTCIGLCCLGFIGLGGMHDFYLGKTGSGIIKLLTLDYLLIGLIVDLYKLINDKYDRRIVKDKYIKMATSNTYTPVIHKYSENGIVWDKGSERQIGWAESVVSNFFDDAKDHINSQKNKGIISEEECNQLIDDLDQELYYQDNANYWIDSKDLEAEKRIKRLLPDNEIVKKLV